MATKALKLIRKTYQQIDRLQGHAAAGVFLECVYPAGFRPSRWESWSDRACDVFEWCKEGETTSYLLVAQRFLLLYNRVEVPEVSHSTVRDALMALEIKSLLRST